MRRKTFSTFIFTFIVCIASLAMLIASDKTVTHQRETVGNLPLPESTHWDSAFIAPNATGTPTPTEGWYDTALTRQPGNGWQPTLAWTVPPIHLPQLTPLAGGSIFDGTNSDEVYDPNGFATPFADIGSNAALTQQAILDPNNQQPAFEDDFDGNFGVPTAPPPHAPGVPESYFEENGMPKAEG